MAFNLKLSDNYKGQTMLDYERKPQRGLQNIIVISLIVLMASFFLVQVFNTQTFELIEQVSKIEKLDEN